MDRLLGLARSPAVQAVAAALVLIVAFPSTTSGTIGALTLCGALGIAVAVWWAHAPAAFRQPPRKVATALVLLAVTVFGVVAFWDTLTESPDWQMGDWGPQHAVLARIMPSLPGLHVPVWNQVVSTGDPPLELYPAFTYLVTGHLALALGLEHDLPLAFMIVATIAHIGLALATAAVASRIAPRPLALAVSVLFLVDGGTITHGGVVGLYHWAILHSALAHVFSMIAALGIMAALKRPRIGASVAIWLATALATATHPASLIMVAASALALLAVAALAGDVPPRRAFAALGHLALGVALGAVVWVPAAERLLAYGQHFSNDLVTGTKLAQDLMAAVVPATSYAFVISAGYLGIAFGLWARRAEVVFVAVVAGVLLLGLSDVPYRAFGLIDDPGVARLGAGRMMLLARPFLYAGAAYAVASLAAHARGAWLAAPRRQRLVAAALIGIAVGFAFRIAPGFWHVESERAYQESRVVASDPLGREMLRAWAADQVHAMTPQTWGRALVDEESHEMLHLTAETGLPIVKLGWIPDLLLRERIDDASDASLARFNVRWVIGVGKSPTYGDPDTEIELGYYHIREVGKWDGKFARIERGAGEVTVRRLDDRAVEIELTGTTEPALVALGTGYYPRWRAHHERGFAEPVYAYPAIPNGGLHVVSAWVAPGRTVFTCDGPLPSDGDGRALSALAALLALAAIVVWLRPRWRDRLLRRIARVRARIGAFAPRLVGPAVGVVFVALAWHGCREEGRPAASFQVGAGARPVAKVEARVDGGSWRRCDYHSVEAEYRCDDVVTVTDGTADILNDALPSWPFTTPAVVAVAEEHGVEVRVTRELRLAGRYWAISSTGPATLAVSGEDDRPIDHRAIFDVADSTRVVELSGSVPYDGSLKLVMVAEHAIEPDRPFLAGPPDHAPF